MAEIGQAERGLVAGAFVVAALVGCVAFWGFTVDDALISVHYARNWASGLGYRFDPGGPVSDGVTPLPWPLVLLPFAHGAALDVLDRARLLGAVGWVATAFVLGRRVAGASASRTLKLVAALVFFASVPPAAWSVSGMETPLAIMLATVAAAARRERVAAVAAGLAVTFRPELAPWALTFAALLPDGGVAPRLRLGAVALAPFALVVTARLALFGHPVPLAVFAKPADLRQGVVYAIAAPLSCATPFFGVSIAALRRGGRARALVVAFGIHLVAVAAAGGDWMPLARLCAPLAPGLLVAFVDVAEDLPRWSRFLRGLSLLGFGIVPITVGLGARRVAGDRAELIARASSELAECKYVAASDVGWVSAALPSGRRILDLGGVTDPEIAFLPGSHTSKRVDPAMLLDRGVDCVVLYVEGSVRAADWRDATYPHAVDQRLVWSDLFASHYGAATVVPFGPPGIGKRPDRSYVFVRVEKADAASEGAAN